MLDHKVLLQYKIDTHNLILGVLVYCIMSVHTHNIKCHTLTLNEVPIDSDVQNKSVKKYHFWCLNTSLTFVNVIYCEYDYKGCAKT